MVLANGSIIHANQHQHADLLWGLRGGTNNLGIVTTIALQTFTQGQIWGGFVTTPYSTADEQVAALAQFSEPTTYDEYASLLTTFAYSGARDMQVIVNNMEYTRAVASPPVYQQLAKLPALASTQRLTNMSDLAAETEKAFPKGMRRVLHPHCPAMPGPLLPVLHPTASYCILLHLTASPLTHRQAIDGHHHHPVHC